MGLKEKRAAQEFQTNEFTGIREKIDSLVNTKVEFDVHWEKISEDGMDHLFSEGWKKVYFEPIISALTNVAADDMGKDALSKGFKKVTITNDNSHSNPDGITFSSGHLIINHKPLTNMDAKGDRSEKIQSLLENGL